MHKSTGNVVAPQEVIAKWGADVLRLWAALCTTITTTCASPTRSWRARRSRTGACATPCATCWETYCDFDQKTAVAFEKLPEMERFFLHRPRGPSARRPGGTTASTATARRRAASWTSARSTSPGVLSGRQRRTGCTRFAPTRSRAPGRADRHGRGVHAPVRPAVPDPVLHRGRGLAFLAVASLGERFFCGILPAPDARWDDAALAGALGQGAGGAQRRAESA